MAVSDHVSKHVGVSVAPPISSVEIEMQPPTPPRLGLPILLLIGVAVTTTFFLANDRRNMRMLAHALHIQLEPAAPPALPGLSVLENTQARPSNAPALTGAAVAPLQSVEPVFHPQDFCRSLGQEGQEQPEFTEQNDGSWSCTFLREYPIDHGASSSFVQIRGGAKGVFSSLRIKFNLSRGGMTSAMLDEALQLTQQSIRPLWSDNRMRGLLKQKLEAHVDFSIYAGYYTAILKHELSDPSRLNLIVMNRPLPQIAPSRIPATWIETIPIRRPMKPTRGGRVPALSPS